MTANVDIRRAGERFHTELSWLESWHCFSFGEHHDPANTHHGLLLVSNDDRVQPSTGFGTHAHRDMEIVTWVLAGQLEHQDSEGNHGTIYPGLVQRMSAGTGIQHSEINPSSGEQVHFVQMWVPPDTEGLVPSYEQHDVEESLGHGGLQPVASGQGHEGAIVIHQRDAVLWCGRLHPDEAVDVPVAPHVHLFVALGDGALDGGRLEAGDAARLTDAARLRFVAGEGGAELLVWATA